MADQMKFRVTPEQVEAARAKLAKAGFPISGESGAVEKDGYRIGYPTIQTLAQAAPKAVGGLHHGFSLPKDAT